MRLGMAHGLATLALAAAVLPASADELDGRRLTLGGFGTIAADYHDADGLEYRRSSAQPDGVDAGRIELATDSLVGVQLNAGWSNELEAVAQVQSAPSSLQRWQPRLTRGFVRYVPDESWMLRVGRIGYEFYPQADSNAIGYSYLTLRPPVEMFGQLPTDDFDGADLTLTRPLGSTLARVKLIGGHTTGTLALADGSRVSFSGSTLGAQIEFLQGPWSLRLGSGWQLLAHPPSSRPLTAALRQTGDPQAQQLAQDFDDKGRRTTVSTIGLTYDDGRWQGRLYLARADSGSPIGPKLRIGTTSLGYRIERVTPYLLLSRAYNPARVQPTGLPDTAGYAALNAGAEAAQTLGQTNQSTAAAGLRYDFARNMDLKFQIDHVWSNSSQLLFDQRSPPRERAELTLFGVALDFVF